MNQSEDDISLELLQIDRKAFIEDIVNQRGKAIDIGRTLALARGGMYNLDFEQVSALEREKENESKGLELLCGLSQMSDEKIIEDHGNGFITAANELTAMRGLSAYFVMNVLTPTTDVFRFYCFIPDAGTSRAYYDKKDPLQRVQMLQNHADSISNYMKVRKTAVYCVLEENNIIGRYRVGSYAEAQGKIEAELTARDYNGRQDLYNLYQST